MVSVHAMTRCGAGVVDCTKVTAVQFRIAVVIRNSLMHGCIARDVCYGVDAGPGLFQRWRCMMIVMLRIGRQSANKHWTNCVQWTTMLIQTPNHHVMRDCRGPYAVCAARQFARPTKHNRSRHVASTAPGLTTIIVSAVRSNVVDFCRRRCAGPTRCWRWC